jgi:hypothetical protein
MAESWIEERQSEFVTEGSSHKITHFVEIERKLVRTNDDIERRKTLVKFGKSKGRKKGDFEGIIGVEDREVYMERPNQPRDDEVVARYNSSMSVNRHHKEALDELAKKEKDLTSTKKSRLRTTDLGADAEEFSVRVSNLPDNIDEDGLRAMFSRFSFFKNVWLPQREQRDFAYVHYGKKEGALEAIRHYNEYSLESQILSVQMAEKRDGRAGQARRRPRGRK